MNLYIIRHADAGDPRTWQSDDEERPLSELGQTQARTLGEMLRQQGSPLDVVVSSPLVRTRETAEQILEGWPNTPKLQFHTLLAPGEMRRRKFARVIAELGFENVAVVGHDPDLPALLGWLIGVDPNNVHLRKGAAALVTFDDGIEKGEGELAWLVTPEWFVKCEPV